MIKELRAELQFSETFPLSDRGVIQRAFDDEGVVNDIAETDIFYKSVSPENLIIGFVITYPVLQFLQGYASAAGADAWEATKRALKNARGAHLGGQEVSISDEDAREYANYIIPSIPSESSVAVDSIASDFAKLEHPEERWWLGPPDSRWGTAMESAERNNPNSQQ